MSGEREREREGREREKEREGKRKKEGEREIEGDRESEYCPVVSCFVVYYRDEQVTMQHLGVTLSAL